MESISTLTADECQARAAECYARRQESWERSDTDGFLSQWASGLNGHLYSTQAEIAANNGMAEFWGLYDLTGNRLPAKMIDSRYGTCWALCDARGQFTGQFVPFSEPAGDLFIEHTCEQMNDTPAEKAKRIAKIEKRVAAWERRRGVSQRREMAPAVARITGTGRGLSGNAWVAVFRRDGGYPGCPKYSGE